MCWDGDSGCSGSCSVLIEELIGRRNSQEAALALGLKEQVEVQKRRHSVLLRQGIEEEESQLADGSTV